MRATMNVLRYSILLFVLFFSFLSADELPTYKMVDLGVFGADESQAHAINDKGQVLGTFREGANDYLFLWDKVNGLTIIEYLEKMSCWNCKLNNNGQIVGLNESYHKVVYWDVNAGFWEIESSKDGIRLVAFNDNGQILGNIGHQMIIWDHGKKINLTNLFHEQVSGKWTSCQAVSLNNRGHVVITANKQRENPQDQNTGTKSFIWKDGSFSMIMPEIGWGTDVAVRCMDDDENMIVSLDGERQYFVNQSKYMFIPCQGCDRIRNGVPISQGCLPGKLKKDRHGNLYFSKGVQIKNLLIRETPYNSCILLTMIADQNSNGYVVGLNDTLYGMHAFLAIPDTAKDNTTKKHKMNKCDLYGCN